mgnify:CR=1 FL=1
MINISFNSSPDAIICLNSILPKKSVFSKFPNIPIIAADGATNQLMKKGIIPNFIVGDLDSCKNKYINSIPVNNLIHIPEQDTNDFEKNINFAQNQNWKKILIFGFHGGELEHTLNNWSIIKKYSTKLQLLIFESKRYCFPLGKGEYSISTKDNEIISLIPQCKAILTTIGLKWELSNEELQLGVREGARNRAIKDKIQIHIHSGEILLFLDSRIPLFY